MWERSCFICTVFSRLCVFVHWNVFQWRALELETAEKFDHIWYMLKQIIVCNNEHIFCKYWHNWQWNDILPKGATAETVCDSNAVRPTLRICNGKNGNIHPIPGNINEITINYVTLQCRILHIFAFFKFTYSTWNGLQRCRMPAHFFFTQLVLYVTQLPVCNMSC